MLGNPSGLRETKSMVEPGGFVDDGCAKNRAATGSQGVDNDEAVTHPCNPSPTSSTGPQASLIKDQKPKPPLRTSQDQLQLTPALFLIYAHIFASFQPSCIAEKRCCPLSMVMGPGLASLA